MLQSLWPFRSRGHQQPVWVSRSWVGFSSEALSMCALWIFFPRDIFFAAVPLCFLCLPNHGLDYQFLPVCDSIASAQSMSFLFSVLLYIHCFFFRNRLSNRQWDYGQAPRYFLPHCNLPIWSNTESKLRFRFNRLFYLKCTSIEKWILLGFWSNKLACFL